jgi:hypothetical protein
MSTINPPEYQQSPPQPPPLPAPPKRHRGRRVLLIIGGAFLALILLIVIISVATAKPKPAAAPLPTTSASATSAPTHTATKPKPAPAVKIVSTTTACNELGAWENGPSQLTLNRDPESRTIAAQTSGTQFGTDFSQWMADLNAGNTGTASSDAGTVSADCVAAGAADPLNNSNNTSAPASTPASSAPTATAPAMSAADQQAVEAAQGYLALGSGFSAESLYKQLTSSYGSGFTSAEANFAISDLNPDWDAQAVEAAKSYMSLGSGFSRESLIQQLTSNYGDGFTYAQAEYAVNQVGL